MRSRRGVVLSAALALAGLVLLSCQAGEETSGSPSAAEGLREGGMAPDFELPSVGGEEVRLSDYRGEKPVLLYFSMGPG